MKIINKWIVMSLCLVLLVSCSKKPEEEVNQAVEVEEKEDVDNNETEEKLSDEINDNAESEPQEEPIEEEPIKEEPIEEEKTDEIKDIDKETLIKDLMSDQGVDEESLYIARDKSFVVYKKRLVDIGSMDGYYESLMYWDLSTAEPIEIMSTNYGITFDSIRSTKSDVQVDVVYPSGFKTEVYISYDQLKNADYPNLYDSDPYHYIKAKIDWLENVNTDTTYMNDDFALFWDADNQTLSMWNIEEGITILEEGMGAYTDMLASPDYRYVAMTLGTSSVRELIVFDTSEKSIVHRTDQVYDSLYWSPNSQFLAFNILNEKVINPSFEVENSMDVGVLYVNDLVAKRVAKGTDTYYLLVEGFSDIGLNVYQADLMFQKTRGYLISSDTLLDTNESFEIINQEEATFTFLEIKFDNEYTTQRVNDGILKLDNFYVRDGYNTLVPEGYLPVASTVDRFNTSDSYLSLFFTFTYRNEEGNEIKQYDSLTYHTKDGVLIDFDTMFKAEEIENVFSQMLIDEVQAKELVLLKDYEGFKEDAKFYFTEDGIIVYYGEGVYTDRSEGPLNIKLLWEDLKGVIDRDTLVY